MNTIVELIIVWGMIFLAWFLGFRCGRADAKLELRDELVKRGHAEYYIGSDQEKHWRIK